MPSIIDSGYAGKTLMPRTIAESAITYWRNYELTKAIAVALGESSGSLGAWHDNLTPLHECDVHQIVLNPELYYAMTVLDPDTGKVRLGDGTVELHPPESEVLTSRDCGLYQINIPAKNVNTSVEYSLRSESTDPAEYEPVRDANIKRASDMYNTVWVRDGKTDIRRWQAWVAYTTGWATFPEWWVWRHVNGIPQGPWVKTGRFIHRAVAGQMNYHLVILKDWNEQQALYYGKRYAAHFGITQGKLVINKQGIVTWDSIPSMPSAPPADGVGPRPKSNNGV